METRPDRAPEADPVAEQEPANRKPGRVQYADDVEVGLRQRSIQHRMSTDSISTVRSISSRQVDPASLIPIEYHTVYRTRTSFKHSMTDSVQVLLVSTKARQKENCHPKT